MQGHPFALARRHERPRQALPDMFILSQYNTPDKGENHGNPISCLKREREESCHGPSVPTKHRVNRLPTGISYDRIKWKIEDCKNETESADTGETKEVDKS